MVLGDRALRILDLTRYEMVWRHDYTQGRQSERANLCEARVLSSLSNMKEMAVSWNTLLDDENGMGHLVVN